MMNPRLGIGLVVGLFAVMTLALQVYRWSRPSDPELVRKLLHIGMGLVTLTLPWLFATNWPVLLLTGGFTLLLAALRFSRPLQRLLGGIIDGVSRRSMGEIYFPVAVGLLFLLSGGDPITFCIPVLILTLADASAALIGKRYGTLRYATSDGEKSVEGSIAFMIVALLSTQIPLLLFTDTGRVESVIIALTLSLLVMLLEAIAWRGLDNLFVPLGAFLLLRSFLTMDASALTARLAIAVGLVSFAVALCPQRIPHHQGRWMSRKGGHEGLTPNRLGGLGR
jgi:phytol kinase